MPILLVSHQTAESGIMCREVEGGDRRLADVGADVPRQTAEPGIPALMVSTMAVKSGPESASPPARSFSSAMRGSASHTVTVPVT